MNKELAVSNVEENSHDSAVIKAWESWGIHAVVVLAVAVFVILIARGLVALAQSDREQREERWQALQRTPILTPTSVEELRFNKRLRPIRESATILKAPDSVFGFISDEDLLGIHERSFFGTQLRQSPTPQASWEIQIYRAGRKRVAEPRRLLAYVNAQNTSVLRRLNQKPGWQEMTISASPKATSHHRLLVAIPVLRITEVVFKQTAPKRFVAQIKMK